MEDQTGLHCFKFTMRMWEWDILENLVHNVASFHLNLCLVLQDLASQAFLLTLTAEQDKEGSEVYSFKGKHCGFDEMEYG